LIDSALIDGREGRRLKVLKQRQHESTVAATLHVSADRIGERQRALADECAGFDVVFDRGHDRGHHLRREFAVGRLGALVDRMSKVRSANSPTV
jgi:hypothetical protein